MKYRKKPVIVEAKKFPDNGPDQFEVVQWVRSLNGKIHLYDGNTVSGVKTSTDANWRWNCAFIETLEGSMSVKVGDYIIKGVAGEFYPCHPEIFEMTYEKAE